MDQAQPDYPVGYGKPPVEYQFQKGQSGNPGGRPRGTKKLVDLLAEALSKPSGFAKTDGSWMTQAEVIFTTLVGLAAGSDLKAKRLLFDVLVKLQRANMCHRLDRLPEIELDGSEDASAQVAAEMDRLALAMQRERNAPGEVPDQERCDKD